MTELIIIFTSQIQLSELTYLGFSIMAMKVVIIALAVLVLIALVFYKNKIHIIKKFAMNKLR